jgi:hypothetical protein
MEFRLLLLASVDLYVKKYPSNPIPRGNVNLQFIVLCCLSCFQCAGIIFISSDLRGKSELSSMSITFR